MSEKKKAAAPEINDPEQLYEYVKIIKPGTWMLLLAAVLMLIVFVLLGTADELLDGVGCGCICDNGVLSVYLGADNLPHVKKGMELLVEGYTFHVTEISPVNEDLLDSNYMYIAQVSDIDPGENIYKFEIKSDLPDGFYEGFVVTERNSIGSYMLGTEH